MKNLLKLIVIGLVSLLGLMLTAKIWQAFNEFEKTQVTHEAPLWQHVQ